MTAGRTRMASKGVTMDPHAISGMRLRSATKHSLSFHRAALLIFIVALALRLAHLWAMRTSPFFQVLVGDARAYDAWAMEIAHGDWRGHEVFYQAPLYAYFLGMLHAMKASVLGVRVCQAVIGAGACVLLGYAGHRLFGRPAGLLAGLMLAGYAPAVFFDGLVQKSVLDIFLVCLLLAFSSVMVADDEVDRHRWGWFGVGVTVGALGLTRENALAFAPVLIAWIWLKRAGPSIERCSDPERPLNQRSGAPAAKSIGAARSRRGKREAPLDLVSAQSPSAMRSAGLSTAIFLGGFCVVLLPVALRNLIIGGEFHLTTTQSGPNFFIGNNPHADGTYVALRYGRGAPEYERQDAHDLAQQAVGHSLSPGEVSSYWFGRALEYIRTQPTAWLALETRKLRLLLSATEIVDTESQESHEDYSPPLRIVGRFTHFGVVLPLACLGMWASWSDRRRLWLLYALIGAYSVSVLAFYVVARYRLPLAPFLIVFGSAALVRGWNVLRVGRRTVTPPHSPRARSEIDSTSTAAHADDERSLQPRSRPSPVARGVSQVVGATFVAILTVVSNWPAISADALRAASYQNLGAAFQENGDLEGAADAYRRALAAEPGYAPAHNGLGSVLRRQGKVDEAIGHLEEALRRRPDFEDATFNLANALDEDGREAEAIARYQELLRRRPEAVDVHANLGVALTKIDRIDEAITHFRLVTTLAPETANAHYNLGHSLLTRGDVVEAIDELSRAVHLAPADASLHYELGNAFLAHKQFPSAVDQFREAARLAPQFVDAHNNLGIALGSAGRIDEAVEAFRAALRLDPESREAQANVRAAIELQQRLRH